MHSITNYFQQHIVISKLKKQAKLLLRENPTSTLMDCQNKIAKQYGYQHWHELHTVFKSRINLLDHQFIDSTSKDNIFLGIDTFSQKEVYLKKYFNQINVLKNNYSHTLIESLLQHSMKMSDSLTIFFNNNLDNDTQHINSLKSFSSKNNIPYYSLSFDPLHNEKNSTYFNLSHFSSGALSELFINDLIRYEDDDINIWKGRAISFITSLMPAWYYLSKTENFELTFDYMRENMIFDNVIKLSQRTDLPHHIITIVKTYLKNLPAYNGDLSKQSDTTLEMHGYLQMQFTKIFGSMSDYLSYFSNTDQSNNTLSFYELLEKQEKFILIIDLPKKIVSQSLDSLVHIFIYLIINSLQSYENNKMYKSEQTFLHYHMYTFFDNLSEVALTEFKNPLKLPLNYIFYDSQQHSTGINLITQDDNTVCITSS